MLQPGVARARKTYTMVAIVVCFCFVLQQFLVPVHLAQNGHVYSGEPQGHLEHALSHAQHSHGPDDHDSPEHHGHHGHRGHHHDTPEQKAKDDEQQDSLEDHGLTVIRFHHLDDWEAKIRRYSTLFGVPEAKALLDELAS